MSRFPLSELKRLLTDSAPVSGIVVSINGDQVRVATSQGLVTARTTSPVAAGSRVLLQNGQALPVAKPIRSYST